MVKIKYIISCLFILYGLSSESLTDSDAVLKSIESLVAYYKGNYMYMNLDGIYGLRLLQGQIGSLVDSFHNSQTVANLEDNLVDRLETIYGDATATIESSIKFVRQSEPAYYEKMSPLIERPILFENHYKMVDPQLRWDKSIMKRVGFSEAFSDGCMVELLGTGAEAVAACSPSQHCLHAMFERGHQEYTLTHQLLYTHLALQCGCEGELNAYLAHQGGTDTIESIQTEFCTNNLFEMVEIIEELPEGKAIPSLYQDLFMEQQLVCPMLGYLQFLHATWLAQVISWQHPSGCFGSQGWTGTGQDAVGGAEAVIQAHDRLLLKTANESRPGAVHPGPAFIARKLLEERSLPMGCSAHETAVAAGALSQYLKAVVHAAPPLYNQHVSLHGANHLLARTWQRLAPAHHPGAGRDDDAQDYYYENNQEAGHPKNLFKFLDKGGYESQFQNKLYNLDGAVENVDSSVEKEESEGYWRYGGEGEYDSQAGAAQPGPLNPKLRAVHYQRRTAANNRPPLERNEDDDPGYAYYEAPVRGAALPSHPPAHHQQHLSPQYKSTLNPLHKHSVNNDAVNKAANNAAQSEELLLPQAHAGKGYVLILVLISLSLLLVFKCVRARRVIIRYRYG